MQDLPDPATLVSLTAEFLRVEIMPDVSGAKNFQLRVAANALDLVARQLREAAASDDAERARLAALLRRDGTLDELNRVLCADIAQGETTLQTPGLAEHLWVTTMAKLAVDQPNYAAYRREKEREGAPPPSPTRGG